MPGILVTGCSGFIGQNLLRILQDKSEYRRVGVDLQALPPSCKVETFLQKDVLDLRKEDLSGISVVIHLAARTGVRASASEATDYFKKNVSATQHLLEISVKSGVRRFFFASSSSVYGDHPGQPEGDLPIGSESCKSFYALTKHQGEVLTWFYSQKYPIQCFALRFFTVYGPQPRNDMLIGKTIECALQGKPIQFFGQPWQSLRSFTYVDDLCDGILKLLQSSVSESWSAWNLGNPENISCDNILCILGDELNKHGYTVTSEYVAKDSQDTQETLANILKASKELGWKPNTSIQDGIHKTVQSVLSSRLS